MSQTIKLPLSGTLLSLRIGIGRCELLINWLRLYRFEVLERNLDFVGVEHNFNFALFNLALLGDPSSFLGVLCNFLIKIFGLFEELEESAAFLLCFSFVLILNI